MSNNINPFAAPTSNSWTPPNNTPLNVRQAAATILADAPFAPNQGDLMKAMIFPDTTKAAAFLNMDKVEAQLDTLAETNPAFAADVRAEVMSKLNPVQQGELTRVQEGKMVMGPDGRGFNLASPSPNLPSQEEWIARAKADGHPDYPRYVAIAGSEDVAAIKQAMDDAAASRATLPIVVTGPSAGESGAGWGALNTAAQTAETANTFGLKPLAKALDDGSGASKLLKYSKGAGPMLGGIGFGAQYMENRANGHSKFASSTGATASTLGPAASGALAGGAVGAVFGKGVGAPVGAVGGAFAGYYFSKEINDSGLSTAEFIEKKVSAFEPTKIEDSKGVTLGDTLDRWLSPPKGRMDR